jgi:3-hydroxymyristoyl/3-hydroxydecanoyl-(acyl carrier protein) dehydratase
VWPESGTPQFVVETSPVKCPDPDWLAACPAVVRLAGGSAGCLVVPLSELGLDHALAIGWSGIRDLALQRVGLEGAAASDYFWRVTGPSLPALPAETIDIAAIDQLLGRTDAREPLFIRTQSSARALHQAFHVPSDFAWFEGHFPGEPILPGIAQVRMAISSGRVLLGHAGQPRAIYQLKFKAPIRPDHILVLNLQRLDDRATVLFSYRSASGEHASGRLAYAAP